MAKDPQLVKLRAYGIKGYNYHWAKAEQFDISKKELNDIGVQSGEAYASKKLIKPLQKANELLKKHGYELFVKDAYRSLELYELAYDKRLITRIRKGTAKLMNMDKMPHANGLAVDVTLLNLKNGREVKLKRKQDGTKAAFINFYKHKKDKRSQIYQLRQLLLRKIMEQAGFKLGVKKEFWHFELPSD